MNTFINIKYMYFLSVLAIFKNETLNLETWIRHYIWQGVDHIYLIDNLSTDNPMPILQHYINSGFITYSMKPEKYKQVQHYASMYEEHIKGKTHWLVVCDLDEFFYTVFAPLRIYLFHMEKFDIIYSKWLMFGSGGCDKHPSDIRTAMLKRDPNLANDTKYIVKTSCISSASDIQVHLVFNIKNPVLDNLNLHLNHYCIQSRHFFRTVKMDRGDVSKLSNEEVRTWDYFDKHDKAATMDDTTLANLVKHGYPK